MWVRKYYFELMPITATWNKWIHDIDNLTGTEHSKLGRRDATWNRITPATNRQTDSTRKMIKIIPANATQYKSIQMSKKSCRLLQVGEITTNLNTWIHVLAFIVDAASDVVVENRIKRRKQTPHPEVIKQESDAPTCSVSRSKTHNHFRKAVHQTPWVLD